MKRKLNMGLALVILLCSFAVPVSATESIQEDMFFDVLAYGYPNGGSSVNIYGSGAAECYFLLPFVKPVRYIDMVVQVGGSYSDLTAQVGGPSVKSDLTCEQISGNLFRVYGTTYYSSSIFYVYFQATNMTSITFKSVRVSFDVLDPVMIEGYCGISAYEYSNTIHYVPTDDINYRRFDATDVAEANWFALFIYTDEWKKFDYVDISIMLSVSSVTTVSCIMGAQVVPMEVSYLNSANWIATDNYITMRIDTRYLDRTSDDYPMIIIEGMLNPDASNFVSVANMCGYAITSSGDKLSILFRDLTTRLSGWFGSLESALGGDTSSGDAFKEDSSTLIGDLGDISASMDAVERPTMDGIDIGFTADITDATMLMSGLFGEVTAVGWLSKILLASVVVALLAYILYGKG